MERFKKLTSNPNIGLVGLVAVFGGLLALRYHQEISQQPTQTIEIDDNYLSSEEVSQRYPFVNLNFESAPSFQGDIKIDSEKIDEILQYYSHIGDNNGIFSFELIHLEANQSHFLSTYISNNTIFQLLNEVIETENIEMDFCYNFIFTAYKANLIAQGNLSIVNPNDENLQRDLQQFFPQHSCFVQIN